MDILHQIFFAIPAIHFLQVKKVVFRHAIGPIASITHNQLWPGSSHSGYLHVIRSSATVMNGHTTFTRAAPVEIRGERNNRSRNFYSVVDGRHENSMTASTGSAC